MASAANRSIFIIVSILLLATQLINCLYETEIYRMLAYDEGTNFYGSKAGSFNLNAAHFAGNLLQPHC